MTGAIEPGNVDREVRLHIYRHFLETGAPPSVEETARTLSAPREVVGSSYQRLADAHVIVLHRSTHDILMANPLSAVPTRFRVTLGERAYWGNCVWDALGVPSMLGRDARVKTSCGCCGAAMTLAVADGALAEAPGAVHFALPARRWWDDVAFT